MVMIRKAAISRKISLYNKAILQAERTLVQRKLVTRKDGPKHSVENARPDQHIVFKTNIEMYALHVMTPPGVLTEIFSKVPFPKKDHFADLGCGLGMQCFIASHIFKDATGFEFNKDVFTEADNIRMRLKLNNVHFKNEDFLNADLHPYNVLFMYLPFYIDFVEKMSEKLKETSPGTLIISFKYNEENVFPKELFKVVYPSKNKKCKHILPSTFVFKRK